MLKRAPRDVIADLKVLYFPDNGILFVLRAIERGEPIEASAISDGLLAFNEKEWRVRDALERLVEDVEGISGRMRLDVAKVADEKEGLRVQLQEVLNPWFTSGPRVRGTEAGVLISKILELNAAIDAVEDALLHGRGRA
jgi:hypothetical protein